MFDYHMHTKFSFDSSSEPSEMIFAAEKAGLKEICFTEHADFPDLEMPMPDLDEYDNAFRSLPKSNVIVKKGLEVGLSETDLEQCLDFLHGRSYDFIICSQHYICGEDPYFLDYFNGKTQHEAYLLYLKEMFKTLTAYSDWDVIGHIGYATRYFPGAGNKQLVYSDFSDILDGILKLAIEHGKGIELNTSGLDTTGDFFPTKRILERYFELGGEIITLGSDAHVPKNVGKYSALALSLLKNIGFKYICTFENRKPIFNKI